MTMRRGWKAMIDGRPQVPWWRAALSWIAWAPVIVFVWTCAIAVWVLGLGGLVGLLVKAVGADIPWTWGELVGALVVAVLLQWVVKVIAAAANGDLG